ncbi:MAG: L-rhamnose mutarotase [Clostridiales bacterium]|nr:L-rhamnose mutarotase [Clostridiales bacterium]
MKRIAQVIGIPAENKAEYMRLHENIPQEVADLIYECNIRNYSIYDFGEYLFAYMEYVGDDYEADMAKMAANEANQRWWDVCKPLQRPLPERLDGEWWHDLQCCFHQD